MVNAAESGSIVARTTRSVQACRLLYSQVTAIDDAHFRIELRSCEAVFLAPTVQVASEPLDRNRIFEHSLSDLSFQTSRIAAAIGLAIAEMSNHLYTSILEVCYGLLRGEGSHIMCFVALPPGPDLPLHPSFA